MALCPEHPKRDQNPKFSPLSETTSIPVYFIWESPTPGEHICGEPIWRPEKSVNIWNLLWLSWLLIICTEQTGIYIRTFPNAITSKKAQNHETSKYIFFKNLDCRLVSHTCTTITQKFKMLWFPNEAR